MKNTNEVIAIIGLGYVGLPLATYFGMHRPTIGYDINAKRVRELQAFHDHTGEVSSDLLREAKQLMITDDPDSLANCTIFIVTVPTPIDVHKRPDLGPLKQASRLVGRYLKKGDLVIYESTVYPGATEEDCVPVLEEVSGLRFNQDFFVGYSPERVNPGDPKRKLPDICKVTSGSTPEVAEKVDALYREIIRAGTHKVSSIKVAEAAKIIENTQRDVNIALINEFALIFNKMGIDTEEVLEAAGTKWNFLPFRPGLVGGHCIGVDPYYLSHKAQMLDYHPDILMAARRLNDGMANYVAQRLVLTMASRGLVVKGAAVLVLGLTFKENCPDLRNTKVIDLVRTLEKYHMKVDVHDPWADKAVAKDELGVTLIDDWSANKYHAIVLAVGHAQYRSLSVEQLRHCLAPDGLVYDLKYVLPRDAADLRL
ncbi:MAG: nucleotide sugar dehydrogenase [Gammaproteobacteria bacterium]|nr:MAG: nucleotide sugar dehydrogenase [Gammaproteobacteria bacterium]